MASGREVGAQYFTGRCEKTPMDVCIADLMDSRRFHSQSLIIHETKKELSFLSEQSYPTSDFQLSPASVRIIIC